MDKLPIKCLIMNIMINFFISGLNHECILISNFFKNALISTSSHVSTNVNTILKYIDVKYSDFYDLNKRQTKKNQMQSWGTRLEMWLHKRTFICSRESTIY